MSKDINLDIRLAKSQKENDDEISKLNTMLAYGSANLGLNSIQEENPSEKRIKEDLEK